MIAINETTQTTVVARRLDRARILSGLSLGVPLLLAAVLNLWNLAQNGYSNTYYSVAVQSMLQSFHNFFFASYDAGGFISVDKPPVALWIQTLSARLFGFSGLSLLLPEALAGVGAVALLYYLVRRVFGPLAGFLAALALALTPIAVAVERGNNTDTWLMFAILLAAWVLSRAVERARLPWLLLAVALAGVAFNIKMLEAFIVLPAFYLLYLVAAPASWLRRVGHLTVATGVLFAVALSWPLAVDLTPPQARPWVGGSQTNSVLELALGYNGLGRVTGQGEAFGGRGGGPPGGFFNFGPGAGPFNFGGTPSGPGFGGRGGRGPGGGPGGPGGGLFDAGVAGPFRLLSGALAGQWSWLLPLALFGLVAVVPALPRRRRLQDPRGKALLLWGGWLAMYAGVFSMAQGIFHPYYLIMLAPAAAALVGIGGAGLWAAYRRGGWRAWLLPLALLVTAVWQLNLLAAYPGWLNGLAALVFAGSIAAGLPLVVTRLLSRRVWRRVAPGLVGVGLLALLVLPLSWAAMPVLAAPANASLPEAGPAALGPGGGGNWTQMNAVANSPLVAYLEANSAGYTYLVGVSNAQQASSLALATGKPVLATGGFMGSDPALTAGKLATMVATRQIRFVMGLNSGGPRGGGSSSLSAWITEHCAAVDSSAYGGTSGLDGLGALPGFGGFGGFGGFRGGGALYDCAPPS